VTSSQNNVRKYRTNEHEQVSYLTKQRILRKLRMLLKWPKKRTKEKSTSCDKVLENENALAKKYVSSVHEG
jgi:uncharacterized protein (DUF2252 family)